MRTRALVIAAAATCLLACTDQAFAAQALQPYGFGLFDSSSWLGGAVAGYNWQRGSLVFGVEGDISGTGLSSTTSDGTRNANNQGATGNAQAEIDWYGTFRGRLGWSTGPLLFYGTGGLAYGGVSLTNNYAPGNAAPALNAQLSSVRAGWVAGAGIDYLLTKNLVLSLEYQYVDLGSVGLTALTEQFNGQPLTGPGASAHAQFQAVTIGLSWKFAPPEAAFASLQTKVPPAPAPDPWQGLYVGGRAGGAWGNSLSVTAPAVEAGPPI